MSSGDSRDAVTAATEGSMVAEIDWVGLVRRRQLWARFSFFYTSLFCHLLSDCRGLLSGYSVLEVLI
jgi:hypothetical protein